MDRYVKHIADASREALMEMLQDIEQNHFLICHTRSGALAMVFTRKSGGQKPLLGAYYTGGEWIPAKWTETGYFLDDEAPRPVDLDFSQHASIDPIEPMSA